jgi:ABC-type transporter Mla MlaB component
MPPQKEDPGLLSRVVRFVKNPTTNWADLDQNDTERESSYSKQMLKEMIERKRRNDFVRKREFDMLRKMRRSEVMAGQDPAARPSFFQSSMPSKPDDRATTLKKIDEIEAQMSMQWWKTKHADAGSRTGGASSQFPVSTHLPPDPPSRPVGSPTLKSTAYTRTEPQPLAQPKDNTVQQPLEVEPMLDLVTPAGRPAPAPAQQVVTMHPVTMQPPVPPPPPAPQARPEISAFSPLNAAAGPPSEPGNASSAFTPSKLFAIDVDEFAHDPELEEASIRFANGDDEGAEAGLQEVLSPSGARVNHDETWLTLFDLYRATGRQDRFETAAIEFASRFGRSAPQWFSMPEIVGRMSAPAAPAAAPSGQALADWTCPQVFGTQTLAAMNAALAKAAQPWRLSWVKLQSIAESAVEPLTRTFTQWASQPMQLRFIGADVFERVLKEATPSGDRGVNPAWWKLRMEVLRVMHRPDEFELVALDYCVTYEVSPPSWDSARCEFKALAADGTAATGHTIIGEAFRDSLSSGMTTGYGDTQMPSVMNSQMSNVATVELAGQILGDATEALDTLESKMSGADVMVISCSRLIRIDFSAAGTLLNWVTARQAEGRQVQFVDVHRLVAAFFNVIGISEHARVIPRHD